MENAGIRRIGVLTSGGDAPGMNAAIRAVVRTAAVNGVETIGINSGYQGLLDGDFVELGPRQVSNIIQRGGTILSTSRCERFFEPDGRAQACANLRAEGGDALVVIGGNGSFQGAHLLFQELRLPVVGVPGTIDNDVGGTEATIGFDTAINTALDAIDRVRDTAFSHHRLFFVEVMGRHCGAIAVSSALAGGAEEVLIPERPNELSRLIDSINGALARGKRSLIVVIAEGDDLGGAAKVAGLISDALEVSARVAVLGHIQRGGSPTAADRILASRMGAAAVEALLRGEADVMTCQRSGRIVMAHLAEAWTDHTQADPELLRLCDMLAQ